MYKENAWFKKTLLVVSLAGVAGGALYWYGTKSCAAIVSQDDYYIYEFNDDERDIQDVEKLFADDLYWLTTRQSYDVRAMLTRRTSEYTNPDVHNNMWIYIMRDKKTDQLIGFTSFFKLSFYKGQILFVSVSKDFRGKGYGKKLTQFDLDTMKQMGMIKATLFTRLDNLPARALYENLGFKESPRRDDVGLYYDIYLD